MKTVNRKVGYLILIVGLVACSAKSVKNSEEKDTDSVSIEVPSFDTDSAYAYIERQVQFGFRVPNTPAHLATADYLSSELARHGAVVEVQQGTVTAYDGTELSIRNIIGSFSPEKKNRILLFAHWDSRPYADNDPDKSKHRQPIAGADDGASGVGVLLEIARQIGKRQPDTGVDIAFSMPRITVFPIGASRVTKTHGHWAHSIGHVGLISRDIGPDSGSYSIWWAEPGHNFDESYFRSIMLPELWRKYGIRRSDWGTETILSRRTADMLPMTICM